MGFDGVVVVTFGELSRNQIFFFFFLKLVKCPVFFFYSSLFVFHLYLGGGAISVHNLYREHE